MAPTPAKNGNGWRQYLIIAVAMAYFGWMGLAIVGLGRELSAMKSDVARLVAARDAEQMQRTTRNSDQIDDIQGNAQ